MRDGNVTVNNEVSVVLASIIILYCFFHFIGRYKFEKTIIDNKTTWQFVYIKKPTEKEEE